MGIYIFFLIQNKILNFKMGWIPVIKLSITDIKFPSSNLYLSVICLKKQTNKKKKRALQN